MILPEFFLSFTPTSNLTSFGAALTDFHFDFFFDGGEKKGEQKRERRDREEKEDESDLDVPLKYSQHCTTESPSSQFDHHLKMESQET